MSGPLGWSTPSWRKVTRSERKKKKKERELIVGHYVLHAMLKRSARTSIFNMVTVNWSERLACAVTELNVHY